jgi:hypothetical protein
MLKLKNTMPYKSISGKRWMSVFVGLIPLLFPCVSIFESWLVRLFDVCSELVKRFKREYYLLIAEDI